MYLVSAVVPDITGADFLNTTSSRRRELRDDDCDVNGIHIVGLNIARTNLIDPRGGTSVGSLDEEVCLPFTSTIE